MKKRVLYIYFFYCIYYIINIGRLPGSISFLYIIQLKNIIIKKNITWNAHDMGRSGPLWRWPLRRLTSKDRTRTDVFDERVQRASSCKGISRGRVQRAASKGISRGRVQRASSADIFQGHLQGAASAELLPRAAPTGVFAWVLRIASSIKLSTLQECPRI